jgi:WD40 repeat protein
MSEKQVPDVTTFLQYVRLSVSFLSSHHSLRSPQELNPRNNLLFYPRPDEFKEILPFNKKFEGLAMAPCIPVFISHKGYVYDCTYSLDGRLVASVSDDGFVWLWDSDTGKSQHVLNTTERHYMSRLIFSSEERGFLAVTDFSKIWLWHVSTGARAQILAPDSPDDSPIVDIAFSPDGDHLLAVTYERAVSWHLPSYEQVTLADLKTLGSLGIRCARFSGDQRLLALASVGEDYQIIVWDVVHSKVRHRLQDHEAYVNDLVFSPDSLLLASGSDDCGVRIWHVETGELLDTLDTATDQVYSVTFSPDGLRLACGSNKNVRIWKVAASAPAEISSVWQYKTENVFKGHSEAVTSVRFSPDGSRLLSSSRDGTLRIWHVNNVDPRALLWAYVGWQVSRHLSGR